MSSIPTYNITLRRNAKWELIISDFSFDLTDYGAKMQINSKKTDTTLVELSTDNGKIIIDAEEGTITLTLTTAEVKAITESTGKYDLILVKDDEGTPILQGDVIIASGVTEI